MQENAGKMWTRITPNTSTLYAVGIKDYVSNDDRFTRKTGIPQDKFLDLVNLVLTTTWHISTNKFIALN